MSQLFPMIRLHLARRNAKLIFANLLLLIAASYCRCSGSNRVLVFGRHLFKRFSLDVSFD